MDQVRIKQFWNWFIDNEYQFREVTDTKTVIELLNNQVLNFGLFAWELGEGYEKPHSFTISPNGDKRRLELSQEIIKQAPDLRQWEFYYCKGIKRDWDYTFEIFNRVMIKQVYDAARWEFVLVEEANGKISILFCAPNIATIDFDDLPAVGNMVVINVLGEETKTNHVHSIQFIDDFLPQDEKWIFDLSDLSVEFRTFLREIEEG